MKAPPYTSADKTKLGRQEALDLARRMDEVWAAKGSRVVRLRIADAPTDEELAGVLLGPSGNLRAPAIQHGRKLLVGFHPEMYRDALGLEQP